MEIQHAQFKVEVGNKLHKVEVFFYEDQGQAYEIDGVLIDGKDVTDELFIIEDLLGISIILKLQDHINGKSAQKYYTEKDMDNAYDKGIEDGNKRNFNNT